MLFPLINFKPHIVYSSLSFCSSIQDFFSTKVEFLDLRVYICFWDSTSDSRKIFKQVTFYKQHLEVSLPLYQSKYLILILIFNMVKLLRFPIWWIFLFQFVVSICSKFLSVKWDVASFIYREFNFSILLSAWLYIPSFLYRLFFIDLDKFFI